MALFEDLLAGSLERVTEVAQHNVVRSNELSRVDRERLLKGGWLTPIIRGWYMLGHPQAQGETSQWYGSYWTFMGLYLSKRFGTKYCLSAESSLDFHLDRNNVPKQLIVIAGKGGNSRIELPHGTSLFAWEGELPPEREMLHGLQIMPLPRALCKSSPALFSREPIKAEIALRMVNPADIIRVLLEGGHTHIAGRMAGAYRFLGDAAAGNIVSTLTRLGYRIKEENPFTQTNAALGSGAIRVRSPYAARIEALWQAMREEVLVCFPKATGIPADVHSTLKKVEELYRYDAYHSLSIEGYQVTPELIEQIRIGNWNPDGNDNQQRNALAAKGYQNAFNAVCISIRRILEGAEPGATTESDLQFWYRELFSPAAQAGLVKTADLAGYRNNQVYIRGARHVPPPKDAVLDAMDAFFKCLKKEPEPAVRAVLGHFMFVYIHPFVDGNGRIGRFLMNVMLVTGGYPWTVIRSEKSRRDKYMQALERASSENDIGDFTRFVIEEMKVEW